MTRSTLIRAVLLVGAAALGLTLALAPKPWEVDLAAFPKAPVELCVRTGLWWGGLANAVLWILLGLTAPLWLRPLDRPTPAALPPLARGFGWTVLAAMAAFALVGAFRLPLSLWDDEEYCARKIVVGTWREKANGQLDFKPVSWQNTLWYYQMPANHGMQSILSRLSNETWRNVVRPQGVAFSETALRLPALLASVLAIGALALLLARAGFPWAGALAAWLLAVHPWFLRLGTEARGYPFLFLFLPVVVLVAFRAVRTGTWSAFFLLAAAEFFLLHTWPGAAFIVLLLNLCVAVLIVRQPAIRNVLVGRWLVSGSLAAGAVFAITAPWLPQLARYLSAPLHLNFGMLWLKNYGALLLTGRQWSESGLAESPYLELYPRALAQPVLIGLVVGVALILMAAGVVRMLRGGALSVVTAAMLALPAPALYAVTKWRDGQLHEWYLAFLLPGLLAFAAVGALAIAEKFGRRRRPVAVVLAGLLVLGYIGFTWNERLFLLEKSAQPFRESVLVTRPNLDPNSPPNRSILTASWLLTPEIYDPRVHKVKSADDLILLMKAADEQGVPLFVNNGYDLHNHDHQFPGLVNLVRDPRLFEPAIVLRGLEPVFDRAVYRYRPNSLVLTGP